MKAADKIPKRVCFVGQQWSCYLSDLVNEYSNGQLHASFLVMDSPWKVLKLWSRLSKSDIWVRVGFRPGSPSAKGLLFDTFWWFLQKHHQILTVYYWIGTDVLKASEDIKRSRLTPFFRASLNSVHLAGAPWLAQELRAIGVPALCVLFPGKLPTTSVPPLPNIFTVGSYIPDSRFEFYGGPSVYEAARRLPFVRFLIWGGLGSWVSRPLPNLRFLGWVTDTAQVYAQASVILRLVKHDALGGSVREGLAMARHVIYTYHVPHTLYVPFHDREALIALLEELYQRHQSRQLGLNLEGRAYALEAWNPRKLTEILIRTLLDLSQ
ncbi:MAG: hypothetical protein QXZ09_05515 [Candidatus Methanomethylicaceae archaeon]